MKKIIKWLRRIVIAGFVFMICVYSISYFIEAPDLNGGHIIRMYDQNQKLFYQSQQQSNDVALKDVSPYFLKSIVAIEDHRFYEHRGFDPVGILRAIKANISAKSHVEGASTLSQQYARLMFLNNEKTWSRKIQEAFLTVRLETHYNKDTILQGYINTVYFGHGIYGIQNASLYYFNKKPIDLDLNEASMLAGVINGIPQPVLGGVGLVMFGMVAAAGIKTLSRVELTDRNLLIIATSMALGLGVTFRPEFISGLPEALQMIFSSGISTGTIVALVLNLVLKETQVSAEKLKKVEVA